MFLFCVGAVPPRRYLLYTTVTFSWRKVSEGAVGQTHSGPYLWWPLRVHAGLSAILSGWTKINAGQPTRLLFENIAQVGIPELCQQPHAIARSTPRNRPVGPYSGKYRYGRPICVAVLYGVYYIHTSPKAPRRPAMHSVHQDACPCRARQQLQAFCRQSRGTTNISPSLLLGTD